MWSIQIIARQDKALLITVLVEPVEIATEAGTRTEVVFSQTSRHPNAGTVPSVPMRRQLYNQALTTYHCVSVCRKIH